MSQPVKVHIEYCGGWGYYPRYEQLRNEILASVPHAAVDGNAGRRTSFEVTLNDTLVFSKLKQGGFPVFERVVEMCIRAAKGDKVETVEEMQKGGCSAM